jgi:hypothetical protein
MILRDRFFPMIPKSRMIAFSGGIGFARETAHTSSSRNDPRQSWDQLDQAHFFLFRHREDVALRGNRVRKREGCAQGGLHPLERRGLSFVRGGRAT